MQSDSQTLYNGSSMYFKKKDNPRKFGMVPSHGVFNKFHKENKQSNESFCFV